MTFPLACNLHRLPCRRPRLPGAYSSLSLSHLPPPLLPQPPPPPRLAQSPNLAPTFSTPFQLGPRILDEDPQYARAMHAGPLGTHARSAVAVCDRLLQCVLLLRACELLGSLPMFRLCLVHDTWSYAERCQSSSGSCLGAGVIWATLDGYRVVGHPLSVPGSSSSSSEGIMSSLACHLTCRTLDLAFGFIGGLMPPMTLGV